MGYILFYILEFNYFLLSASMLVLMEIFAVKNTYQRIKKKINPGLRRVIVFALSVGTAVSLFYFMNAVLNIKPWYEARYLIPIGGMLIGNSMTGVSLGTKRLIGSIRTKRDIIEGALMLGAAPKKAAQFAVRNAFAAAIMPTINSMAGMGIVFLPGMMTGQILSGVSPLTAQDIR